MAAEGGGVGGVGGAAPSCVNGAAAGWPRKAICVLWYSGVMHRRQWGRGRMAAEGGGSMFRTLIVSECVNGAAAGWPRKGAAGTSGCTTAFRVNGAAAGWPRKAFCR